MTADELREAERIVRYIGPLLAGKESEVQAAVLADLTATFVHGHRGTTLDSTLSLRAEILSLHCAAVRRLVILADEETP